MERRYHSRLLYLVCFINIILIVAIAITVKCCECSLTNFAICLSQGAKAAPGKKESAKSGPAKGTPVAAPAAAAKPAAGGGVSEEEAKALLRSSGPIKSQDLVAKFKSRLKTQEVSKIS